MRWAGSDGEMMKEFKGTFTLGNPRPLTHVHGFSTFGLCMNFEKGRHWRSPHANIFGIGPPPSNFVNPRNGRKAELQ